MAESRTRPPASRRVKKGAAPLKPSIDFHRRNLYLMALAALTIVVGYVLLASGNKDLAAFLLVVGYLGLFPYAIVAK